MLQATVEDFPTMLTAKCTRSRLVEVVQMFLDVSVDAVELAVVRLGRVLLGRTLSFHLYYQYTYCTSFLFYFAHVSLRPKNTFSHHRLLSFFLPG